MTKLRPDDISVGKDRWIEFIELNDRRLAAVEIDEILNPIFPFLDLLENDCVAECCGIDAYTLWPDDVAEAARKLGSPDLALKIERIKKQIATMDGDAVVSHKINNYFHKGVFLQLIDHIASSIRNSNGMFGKTNHDEP